MIPIRDSMRSETFPIMNLSIIVINVLVFVLELSLDEQGLTAFLYTFGIVPFSVTNNLLTGNLGMGLFVPFLTTMFLHGGWVHLIGNMLFLWVFGDNIEDRLGNLRYLLFYLLVGVAATIGQILIDPLAREPLVGASGAIAGILGAYILCYPKSKIVTLLPIFFFFTFVEVPALFFLILWFLIQAFNGLASIGATGNAVAWWAHIGGFVAGMALIRIFPKRKRNFIR